MLLWISGQRMVAALNHICLALELHNIIPIIPNNGRDPKVAVVIQDIRVRPDNR